MANTINADAIAKIIAREYQRDLTQEYEVLPYANRDFKGEIKQKGDTVRVLLLNVGEWQDADTPGGDIPASDLEFEQDSLKVEQVKEIRHMVSDYEMSVIGTDLDTQRKVGEKLRDKAQKVQEDYFVSKLLGVTNKVANPVALTGANIYTEALRIRTFMNKKNVPKKDRQLFVSPEISELLLSSNILVGFKEGYVKQREGEIGMLAGFTVIETNSLTGTNAKKMIGYQGKAGTFVEKLNNIEITRSPEGFYYNIKGQLFFDAGVLGNNKDRICLYEGQ